MEFVQQRQFFWGQGPEISYPDETLVEIFERQVAKTPDAIAAIDVHQRKWSFSQLNERANQLARHLRELGAAPDTFVAIAIDRSLEMLLGVWAILKAGAAYLPIDPGYPQQRFVYLLDDSRARILLVKGKTVAGEFSGAIVDLANEDCFSGYNRENLSLVNTSQHLAYALYTSGSTGVPKGVMVEHRNVVQLLHWIQGELALDAGDALLGKTTIGFDVSIYELFLWTLVGCRVCLLGPQEHKDPAAIVKAIALQNISVIHFVPSMCNAFLDFVESGAQQSLASLRWIFLSGEAATTQQVQRLRRVLPGEGHCRLMNQYGPTETTVNVSYFYCTDLPSDATTVPIGKPQHNIRLYILDADMNPCPAGAIGELYIAGAGVARGYLNRPALSAERFVADLCQPGQRMYKSGDLARWRDDGNIEFLGRTDDQVKVRGFRIELGEIEATLRQHQQVIDAVVIVREEIPGNKQITAYASSRDLSLQLREWTQQRLPAYMVPSTFVVLDALPLSANGKVDRRALPAPDRSRNPSRYTPPQGENEKSLAEIWQQLLHLEQVGRDEDFFQLGGHSLLAMQMMSRIRDTFRAEVSIDEIFATPFIAGLAQCIENATGTSPTIVPIAEKEPISLSFAQERLWFLHQLAPSSAYNISGAVRLRGNLQIELLRHSFQQLIARHQALRTTFSLHDDEPHQQIADSVEISLAIEDLRSHSLPEAESKARELVEQQAQQLFDLAQGPLLRVQLLHLDNREYVLAIHMHHIIADGWSLEIFIRELGEIYQALAMGHEHSLSLLPVQYSDFSQWQRQWLDSPQLRKQLAYWCQTLADAPVILDLPIDYPRPSVQRFAGAHHPICLGKDLLAQLRQFSRAHQVTVFMALLAAFDVLLYRYSGQRDICVGSPIANRNRGEIEDVIGFFANTLVLRNQLSARMRFTELLQQVKETTIGAYANQDIPFEKVVEKLAPQRNTSHTPLFQAMLAFVYKLPQVKLGEVAVAAFPIVQQSAKFDLTLNLWEGEQEISGNWEYNCDLFRESTIAQINEHFRNILASVVANPQQALQDIPLMDEREQYHLLVANNDTAREFSRDLCLHQLFEQQAQKTPDVLAVVYEQQQLTYRELDAYSNQLARYLRQIGVGRDSLVGICLDRSIEMIVAVLAVLKAGAAYVALDPSYPQERLQYILDDTQVPVVIADSQLASLLPKRQHCLLFDREREKINAFPSDHCDSVVSSDNLAYVIYTSGSTGEPKGVCCPHLGAVNLITDAFLRQFVKPGTNSGFWISLNFDLSVYEIFATLFAGTTLHIFPNSALLDVATLIGKLQQCQIHNTILLPSMLRALCDWLEHNPGKLSLQSLGVGLEPIPEPLLAEAGRKIPGLHVLTSYGPTEATIFNTIYYIEPHQAQQRNAPIGKPVQNNEIYILDESLQPVPVGVYGEIYIGGLGVSRGYLGSPALTAAKFIANPFGTRCGDRLYRTGDLARYLPDGNIEFFGRIDNQVKIRGFRIELGEIEATLAQHPQIQYNTVIVREDSPGDKRLVAYLVPSPGATIDSEQLRQFLRQKLPEHMIPSFFLAMAQLPLLPNGKIDTRALPKPENPSERPYLAPRDEIEHKLTAIWQQVLKIERVGIRDNFFDLGGHSLLATQLVSRIEQQLRIAVPLRILFECLTVEELAQYLRECQPRDNGSHSSLLDDVEEESI